MPYDERVEAHRALKLNNLRASDQHHMRALAESLGPVELRAASAEDDSFSEDRAISEALQI